MGSVVVTRNIVKKSSNIIEFDPYDQKLIRQLKKYDLKIGTIYSDEIDKIKKDLTEEEYQLERMVFPCFRILFCTYDGDVINNVCCGDIEKDLKRITLFIDEVNYKIYKRLTEYCFSNLGLEEVIVLVEKENKSIIKDLIKSNYIPLFDDGDHEEVLPFIKEKKDYSDKNMNCM